MNAREMDALRAALAAEPSVQVAYVFGSAGRGEDSSASDVDVALLAGAELGLDRRARFSETLARALSFSRRVDVVDLRATSPVLMAEVVRDGVVVLERDREARIDFEMDAIRKFEDTRPLRRLQHELLREAGRGRA
jgi:uncharacterized protein